MTPDTPCFHIVMLATAQTDGYSRTTAALWRDYAHQHGYNFTVCRHRLINDMHINWSKIELVRTSLADRSHDHIVLVDADTMVVTPQTPLACLLRPNRQIVFSADNPFPRLSPDFRHLPLRLKLRRRILPNAGFIIIANTAFSRQFFDDWLSLARGPLARYADRHPRNQNVLWRGLLNQHGNEIAILGNEILRMTVPSQLSRLHNHTPFAVHFSHKNIDVTQLLNHIRH